jgi:hypothetical protein
MFKDLYEIIEYIGQINNLNEWDLIMIDDEFYEFKSSVIVNWHVVLYLINIELNEKDEIKPKNEETCVLNIFEKEVCFEWEDFDLEEWKILLEKIIEKYKK